MIIKKLEIEELYGYINKKIDFYEDVSIVVGINGAGKTSILNVLNWLLKPSIPMLCTTHFKSASVSIIVDGQDYNIRASHNNSKFKYEIIGAKKFHPLEVTLNLPVNQSFSDGIRDDLYRHYRMLGPDSKEVRTWEFLKQLPDPIVVGLDRYLYTEEDDVVYYEKDKRRKVISNNRKSDTPIKRVKEIVNEQYRKAQSEVLKLTNDLKNHLMLSTFNESISIESFASGMKVKLKLSMIEQAEKSVIEYFDKFEKNTFSTQQRNQVENYFTQLKTITAKYTSDPEDRSLQLLYGLNASQFKKVLTLLKKFEKFEERLKDTFERIDLYLNTINFFFKDSNKKLVFKTETSELYYHILDKENNAIRMYNDLKYLSSGEQQILILLTYLTFNPLPSNVFIIDEPELSLHVKWQEDFMANMKKLMPSGTQVIVATHSPILVGQMKQNAILLYPYNT